MARRRFWKRDRQGRFASTGSGSGQRKVGRLRQAFRNASAYRAQQRQDRAGTSRGQRRDARRARVIADQQAQDVKAWGIYKSEAAFNRAASIYEVGGGSATFRQAHERQTEAWRRG